MARKTKAESAAAGAKDPNPKQIMKPKLDIHTRENDSKKMKRCGHSSASVRPEDTETALQGIAKTAANVSAESPDSIQPSPAELPERNGRRLRSGLRAEDFIPSKWASMSVDELVAATALVQMKNDPNYQSAPVQKKTRTPRRNLSRQGRRS